MRIVFFSHPSFLGSQSMPRFAAMLTAGMESLGHQTELWQPEPLFYKLPVPQSLRKWMGYVDQYIVFPAKVRERLKSYDADTLFVFTDQALGPWAPLIVQKPHLIHCHDFLAQRSAVGEIAENPTGKSGQLYQKYIRKGYQQASNFISVSKKTQQDLHRFLGASPKRSEVVYNGLNQDFQIGNSEDARRIVGKELDRELNDGYLLHVGGNQWYKNRVGVIDIYSTWRATSSARLPLLLVGPAPNSRLIAKYNSSPYKYDIHLLTGKTDEFVRKAYQGASVFLFPSLAEGFGWPIAEAMASGCPVITTNEAPMTEVGGSAAFYIPRHKADNADWSRLAANTVEQILSFTADKRQTVIDAGVLNAQRFNTNQALKEIEGIYKKILTDYTT